jgi:hypothetical protein
MVRGKGEHQITEEYESLIAVLQVFSDEKEHRYKDIKKKIGLERAKEKKKGLTDPTLIKVLKRLIELKLISQRWDMTTYPHGSYYKAQPYVELYFRIARVQKQQIQEIEKIVKDPQKTPLDIIDQINIRTNNILLSILKSYKEDKNMPADFPNFMLELVWSEYEFLTSTLVSLLNRKAIQKIDFDDLIEQNAQSWHLTKDQLMAILKLKFSENETKIREFMEKIRLGELDHSTRI